MNDTTPAEQSVLGITVAHPDVAGSEVFAHLQPTDFTGPNMLIAESLYALRVRRAPIDLETLAAEMHKRGTLNRIGGLGDLHRILGYTALASLQHYLRELVEAKRLRLLDRAARQTASMIESAVNPAEVAQFMASAGQSVLDAEMTDEDIDTQTLDEFLAGDDPEYDWVVPGVLERSDRLLLTGLEGLGKSTLFRQLAVCIAAGIHPFTHKPMAQHRVLYVDVENGPVHMRRKLRPLAAQARLQGQGAGQTLFVEGRPEGLNLLSPAGQSWLLRRVSALQPSVLFTGSLYKLFEGDPNKEEPARMVASVLDRCRAAANCAIVVEAHSGHGSADKDVRPVRPIGASLWLRWPEFGYGLRPARDTKFDPAIRLVEFASWRGDRDERDWPKRLKAGSTWPFEVAADPDGEWTPHRAAGAA